MARRWYVYCQSAVWHALSWPFLGSQPFYFSYGDNTGFGQHADYVFGWKGNSLQTGMDATNCFGARCKDMKTQSIEQAKQCSVKPVINENRDGCKSCPFSFDVAASKLTYGQGSTSSPAWRCNYYHLEEL